MEKILAGIISFILCDYLWILGAVVLVRGIYHIVTKEPGSARLHPVPAWMLVGCVLVHTVLYLCLAQEPNAVHLAAQCFVPAFIAQTAGRFTHKKKPGGLPEAIVTAAVYAVSYILAELFTDWIVGAYLVLLFLFWITGGFFYDERKRCRKGCRGKNACEGCCQGCCPCGKDRCSDR
jgi:hypothetical protein